jgi:hypothetical protein
VGVEDIDLETVGVVEFDGLRESEGDNEAATDADRDAEAVLPCERVAVAVTEFDPLCDLVEEKLGVPVLLPVLEAVTVAESLAVPVSLPVRLFE